MLSLPYTGSDEHLSYYAKTGPKALDQGRPLEGARAHYDFC